MPLLNAIPIFINSKVLPLIFSILGFGLLIVVHEFGHFFFCKLFGIHTPTFSIGFGKPIIEKKIGTTNFRIARIPFGGYVEIAGLQEVGQGDQKSSQATDETSFAKKAFWKKFLVLMGGILFNLIFAYAAFSIIFMIGDPSKKEGITIGHVLEKSAAHKGGLKAGDQILKINKFDLTNSKNASVPDHRSILLQEIQSNPDKEINLLIERNNKQEELRFTLGSRKEGTQIIGALGAHLIASIPKLPFFQAIKMGINTTNMWIYNIAYSIKSLFTKRTLKGAGGPVMILALGFKTAQSGFIPLFIFFAIMSINLALFNLLPLGITDGGQLVFASIEAIIRRPVPEIVRIVVNVASFGLFIFLAVYLTYKDLHTLFGKAISGVYNKVLLIFK